VKNWAIFCKSQPRHVQPAAAQATLVFDLAVILFAIGDFPGSGLSERPSACRRQLNNISIKSQLALFSLKDRIGRLTESMDCVKCANVMRQQGNSRCFLCTSQAFVLWLLVFKSEQKNTFALASVLQVEDLLHFDSEITHPHMS